MTDDIRRPPTEMYTHPEIIQPWIECHTCEGRGTNPNTGQDCEPCKGRGVVLDSTVSGDTVCPNAVESPQDVEWSQPTFEWAPVDMGGEPLRAMWDTPTPSMRRGGLENAPVTPEDARVYPYGDEEDIAVRMADAKMEADRHRMWAIAFRLLVAAALLAITIVSTELAIERYGMNTLLALYIVGIVATFIGIFSQKG